MHSDFSLKILTLDQPEENSLNKEGKRRFQAITGSVMYLGQVTRYDIGYAVNQLARVVSKPSKPHMAAVKYLIRYLAGQRTLQSLASKGVSS